MSGYKDHNQQARIGIACPHCDQPTRIRSSRTVTATYRQLNLACTNAECGATYRADISITHVISQPARANPAVVLRVSPPRPRTPIDQPIVEPLRDRPANDDAPPRHDLPCGPEVPHAANDDGDLIEARG